METECGADTNHGGTKTRRKDGRVHKSQKGRSVQPRSPEEGRTYLIVIGWRWDLFSFVSMLIDSSLRRQEVPYKPDLSISGGSSDDSYLSADEDSAEGPRFVRPIEDTTAPGGAEATLVCVIAGSPRPTGIINIHVCLFKEM